jgi:hypothetical protein
MAKAEDVQRYRTNLQGEVDGAALYGVLAEAESDPNLAAVYRKLASVERAHAQFWRGHLDDKGVHGVKLAPSFRARALSWLATRFGPSFSCRRSRPAKPATSTPMTTSRKPSPAACRPTSAPMPGSSAPPHRLAAAFPVHRWRRSRAVIAAAAAIRCGRRCSAPMTAWCPI